MQANIYRKTVSYWCRFCLAYYGGLM